MPHNPESHTNKDEHRAARRIVGGIIGASIAGGAALGLAACDSDATPTSANPTPTVEASTPTVSATPEASSTPETPPAPEIQGVSADLPAEVLVPEFMDLIAEWEFAGATDDTIAATKERAKAANLPLDDFLAEQAEQNAAPYIAALLPEDWEQDASLVAFRDDVVEQNAGYMKNAIGRYTRGEPLLTEDRTFIFEGTYAEPLGEQAAPDGERTIWFRMERDLTDTQNSSFGAYYYLTFDTSDGTARLSDYLVGNNYVPSSD